MVQKYLLPNRARGNKHHVQRGLGNEGYFLRPAVNPISFSCQTLLAQLRGGQKEGVEITLEKSILALKILRKLIVHGLKKPDEHAEAMAFVSRLFDEAKIMLDMRRGSAVNLRENLEKYTVLCQKIWSDLLGEFLSYLLCL